MATWFASSATIVAAPSDLNDGRDAIGFGLVAASFTTSTKTLTKTGAFASYTFTEGDILYISGGTGVTAGLYEIASRTSDDAIVLVADIGGTDPADVTSSDGPFSTLAHAFNNAGTGNTSLASGDEIRVCGTFLYTNLTTGLIADLNLSGSRGSWMKVVGCNARGVEDGTKGVVKASGSTSFGPLLSVVNLDYCIFRNMDFDGDGSVARVATGGVDSTTDNGSVLCDFHDCTFHGMSGDGVKQRANYWRFDGCSFYDNGGAGFQSNDTSTRSTFYGCDAYDNDGDGFSHGRPCKFHSCKAYGNGVYGYEVNSGACEDLNYSACLAYGNGSDGFFAQSADTAPSDMNVMNCTSVANGGYGFSFRTATHSTAEELRDNAFVANNHAHGNTLGAMNLPETWGSDFMEDFGVSSTMITGDPKFANVTAGSEDFTPAADSPLVGAGFMGMQIGPIPPVAGGGMTAVPPFRQIVGG